MVSKTKRMIFVSALVFSIMTAGAYGAKLTYAQDSTTQSTLVQKIAEKFNLKTADVQAVFDQQRQEHMAEMEKHYEQKLTDAVARGELTEDKKQLIIAKHKELVAKRQSELNSMKSMTKMERKAAIEKSRTELEAWAKNNGIDLKFLMQGPRGIHGFKRMK